MDKIESNERFEALVDQAANRLREAEPGCQIIIFAVRGVDKAPHAPVMVCLKGEDNVGLLGLLKVGSTLMEEMIFGQLGMSDPQEDK